MVIRFRPVQLLEDLNEIAGTNGIGRVDVVENRVVGMKSRGVYETPGGTLITAAHRELEALCLDRQTKYQKDILSMTYAQMVYDGHWFTPLREALRCFLQQDAGSHYRFGDNESLQGHDDRKEP